MADWASQVTKPAAPAQSQNWAGELTRPKTFEEARAERDAATTVSVNAGAISAAEALARDYPDPRNLDAQGRWDTSVGIEQFVTTNAPPILPAKQMNFVAALKKNMVSDPETQRRVIGARLFPNDPNAHNRVGMIDNKPVYVDDNGQLRMVSGSWSRFGAAALANSPEMILSGLGSVSAHPAIGGTLGAAGAHGIKRGIAGLMFDEPQTIKGNLGEMAGEGAVNLVAGGIGKGIGAVAGRGKVVDFTPADVKSATQARDYIKNSTGIDVDLAQASGNRKLIALRAYAARYPGKSAELVQAAEEAQQGQLDAAVSKVLGQIAKSAPSEVSGVAGINAAGMVLELARGARDKAVAPFYEAARKVSISGDVAETLNKDPVLRYFSKKVEKDPLYQRQLGIDPDATTAIRTNESPSQRLTTDGIMNRQRMEPVAGSRHGKTVHVPAQQPVNTVGYWHQVQQAIDDEIAKNAGEPNRIRILTQVRKDLNQKLEAASPEFAEANAHYAHVTRDTIEPLESSAVGVLSRITSPKAATAAARILSDANVSPAEIRATLVSLNRIDPEAGPGLVRQWIAQNWNKALKETQTGAEVNAAGKLRQAIYGDPSQKAKADAMIPPAAKQAFNDLMTAAQALSRTPSAGSNTARDLNIEGQLKGQGGVIMKWLTSPRSQAKDALEQRAVEKNTLALTEALLDPAKQNQLKIIVKMQDSTKKAIALSALLSGQVISTAAARDADHMPLEPTRGRPQQGQR
jgi:hypothetical protein